MIISSSYIRLHYGLQAGASPHIIDNNLRTPLMEATQNGHLPVIKTLVKSGAIVEAKVMCPTSTFSLTRKTHIK